MKLERERPRSTTIGPVVRRLVALAFALLAFMPAARSQDAECEQIRRDMASAGRGDPGRAAQFVRAAQRQRIELQRTQGYADQIGCRTGLFSIFGNDSPAQCDGIHAQIERMTNNLNALQAQIDSQQGGDRARQADLAAQYQTYCSTAPVGPSDGFDSVPGQDDALRPGLDDPDGAGDAGQGHTGGSKAICVRTCDGGFFPLSYAGAQRNLSGLQDLCTALCPNTEAKLYTTADTDNIGDAVSADGARYTDLATAFKYQKTLVPTCTCKPPNKTWVEALADAEKLLDKGIGNDVTVTAKMSEDMAKPGAAAPASAPTKRKTGKASRKADLDLRAAAEGALGSVGAQAPTAGTESAGIVKGVDTHDPVVRSGEGQVKTLAGPDGVTRRVRIIAPQP